MSKLPHHRRTDGARGDRRGTVRKARRGNVRLLLVQHERAPQPALAVALGGPRRPVVVDRRLTAGVGCPPPAKDPFVPSSRHRRGKWDRCHSQTGDCPPVTLTNPPCDRRRVSHGPHARARTRQRERRDKEKERTQRGKPPCDGRTAVAAPCSACRGESRVRPGSSTSSTASWHQASPTSPSGSMTSSRRAPAA